MGKNKEKISGSDGFDRYYGDFFGERWGTLKKSLLEETVYTKIDFGQEKCYFLDPGSVCAALCLPSVGGEKFLDLCAAPGGKTLVIASCINDEAVLYSNERSGDRKARLVKVVSTVLPSDISSRVKISCSDGATWCRRETESFDRILLDAPCSSERHVLQDPKYLSEWTPSRIKTLSIEQWALLSSAWRLLRKDGYLVYATCALSPQENDMVIQKLLKKFDDVEVVSREETKLFFQTNMDITKACFTSESGIDVRKVFECAETTEFGYHVLPDVCFGCGPLYFCVTHKINL